MVEEKSANEIITEQMPTVIIKIRNGEVYEVSAQNDNLSILILDEDMKEGTIYTLDGVKQLPLNTTMMTLPSGKYRTR